MQNRSVFVKRFSKEQRSKRSIRLVCVLALLIISFGILASCDFSPSFNFGAKRPLTTEEIYKNMEKSVGTIISYRKDGSELCTGLGFVYSNFGEIITNYHTIANAISAEIKLNGTTYEISSVLGYDKIKDFAIVKVNSTNLVPLTFSNEDLHLGSTVYAIGTSKSGILNFVQGFVSKPSVFLSEDHIHYEPTNFCNNSGGPLLNIYGEVVGINVGTDVDLDNEYHKSAISSKSFNSIRFSNALTFLEFYKKEGNPFLTLKNFVIANGTYNPKLNKYEFIMDIPQSSSGEDAYFIMYDVENKELEFVSMLTETKSDNYPMIDFVITEDLTGSYLWTFTDKSENFMYGNVTAQTFTIGTTKLDYEYSNISYDSLRNSVAKLSAARLMLLLERMDIVLFEKTGVSVTDLGFYCFVP